jgi:tRNA (guanine-N7-)-methyltransferase
MTIEDISMRAIRSFVRRSGRLTPGQEKALAQYWPLYGIDFQPSLLDQDKLTQGFEALKLEIGFGSGEALSFMAQNDPSSLYVGIEVHQPGVGRCLNSIHDNELTNVRLIKHDAIEVMQHMLAPETLDRVLLFFPDPWHKKRHNKRRIVNQQFRDLLVRLLKPGASLHMATDWQDYAEHMAREMIADQRFKNRGDENGYAQRPDYRPETRFEKRGLRLGHGVWDIVFEKK